MMKERRMRRVTGLVILLGGVAAMTACQLGIARIEAEQTEAQANTAAPQEVSSIVIENEAELPETYPHAQYQVRLRAHGGVPVLHWRLEKGALPPGMKIEDDGLLHGQPERTGEFQFTVSVRDGSQPQQAVQKAFVLRVRSALIVNWKTPAHVNGNRIEGSVQVSNTTADDVDLTFIVLAIAENGRATAIGYQHFVMRRGTIAQELPFGETLPRGGYAVHVDVVGEVAKRRLIYRERLQTPSALQVTTTP